MKKQICITVDMENWITAKQKIENISEYLNECLKGVSGKNTTELNKDKIIEEIKAISESINELQIKKSVKELDLKILREKESETAKQYREKEQYKRWKCPICGKPLTLDSTYCDKCRLNTRPMNDSKIEYIYLEGI